MKPGQWHPAVLALQKATGKVEPKRVALSLDGERAGAGDAAWLTPHWGDICIGWTGNTRCHDGKTPQRTHAFTGQLDDTTIWNRALSPSETQTR